MQRDRGSCSTRHGKVLFSRNRWICYDLLRSHTVQTNMAQSAESGGLVCVFFAGHTLKPSTFQRLFGDAMSLMTSALECST